MYSINIKEKIPENQMATLHLMKPTWIYFLMGQLSKENNALLSGNSKWRFELSAGAICYVFMPQKVG